MEGGNAALRLAAWPVDGGGRDGLRDCVSTVQKADGLSLSYCVFFCTLQRSDLVTPGEARAVELAALLATYLLGIPRETNGTVADDQACLTRTHKYK